MNIQEEIEQCKVRLSELKQMQSRGFVSVGVSNYEEYSLHNGHDVVYDTSGLLAGIVCDVYTMNLYIESLK